MEKAYGITCYQGRKGVASNRGKSVAWVLKAAIKGYQLTLSPYFGSHCRFYPSCSQYAAEALQRYSLYKALTMIAWRVLRCQPWCAGGVDPVA